MKITIVATAILIAVFLLPMDAWARVRCENNVIIEKVGMAIQQYDSNRLLIRIRREDGTTKYFRSNTDFGDVRLERLTQLAILAWSSRAHVKIWVSGNDNCDNTTGALNAITGWSGLELQAS